MKPEARPGGINRAVGELAAGDPDDADDHGEDGKAEDEKEEAFTAKRDMDAPEKSNRNCDD